MKSVLPTPRADSGPQEAAEISPADQGSVLALIPAWNEAGRLAPIVAQVAKRLPVLVVDDGSQDSTAEAARRAGAKVVSHKTNQGKGVALRTGFAWALEAGYQAVLTLDADGQHDPSDIDKFLEALAQGKWDLIIGRRDFRRMPFPRRFTNPFGTWLLSRALGQWIDDNQSGYRIYTRPLLEDIDTAAAGFEAEVEVIIQAVCRRWRIGWVDIRTIYGIDKVSYFHPIADTARFLKTVWRAYRIRRHCLDRAATVD
jgi:glycosyltransferase involved in cell wall biosynthesis